MSDLIDRQAAIEALQNHYEVRNPKQNAIMDECVMLILKLPSAQPELPREIQDILDYLDTVLHPIISPENWNVYSELHDMISSLPSAQPERKTGKWIDEGIAFVCSECGIGSDQWTNYCPNCGAKMEDDHET